jgi:hypothetical protein
MPYYENAPDRKPVFEDIGCQLTISGLVMQGMGSTLILLHPGAELPGGAGVHQGARVVFVDRSTGGHDRLTLAQPTLEEWAEIIRQSDDPEAFVGELDGEGGLRKKLHRKQLLAISGEVQQRVWARDGFACVYCGAKMGTTLMSIDHFVPLEEGGANDSSNYVTACRRDNKAKGMMMPEAFCRLKGYDYERIKAHLEQFKLLAA